MTRWNTSMVKDGDYRYLAPEILSAMSDGTLFYTTVASDCYVFAMTILSMLTLDPPFVDCPNQFHVARLVEGGTRPSRPDKPLRLLPPDASDKLWRLLQRMWAQYAGLRPGMDAIYAELVTIRSLVPSQ